MIKNLFGKGSFSCLGVKPEFDIQPVFSGDCAKGLLIYWFFANGNPRSFMLSTDGAAAEAL